LPMNQRSKKYKQAMQNIVKDRPDSSEDDIIKKDLDIQRMLKAGKQLTSYSDNQ
jgi:hypothetical protein